MTGDRVQQALRDLVWICVQKPHPAQVFDACEFLQQQRQAVLQSKIFAVAGRVLADQRDLAHARLAPAVRLPQSRIQIAATEIFPAIAE